MENDVLAVFGPTLCKSAAGWYLGYAYSPIECPEARWPYSRDTEYFPTKEDAKDHLEYWIRIDPDLNAPRDDQGNFLEFAWA